jgi:hypothetical protein
MNKSTLIANIKELNPAATGLSRLPKAALLDLYDQIVVAELNPVLAPLADVIAPAVPTGEEIQAALALAEALDAAPELEVAPVAPELTDAEKAQQRADRARRSMVTTMAYPDRSVVNVDAGEIYANGSQAWKDGKVSSSQCDRLTKLLMDARKRSEFPVVAVNGVNWQLAEGFDGQHDDLVQAGEWKS